MKSTTSQHDIKAQAYNYYVQDGLSIDTIARSLEDKVSRRTLYNWKETENWEAQRKKLANRAKDFEDIIWNLIEVFANKAITDPDPQTAYAISSLVSAAINNKKLISIISTEQANTKGEKPEDKAKEMIQKVNSILGIE